MAEPWSGLSYALHHKGWGDCLLCTDDTWNDDLTIDRIENEKGYDSSNCRWATMREQQNNKRSNHIVYLGEVGHTISEWSEILGIGKTTIKMRLESGWSDEDALTVPVRKRTRGFRPSASCNTKMDEEE